MSRAPKPKSSRIYKVAALLLILNAIVCLNSLGLMSGCLERVISSRETVTAIDRVMASLQSAEAGVRTVLLSGDGGDRERVGRYVFGVDQSLDRLQERAKNEPLLGVRAASLRHVVSERNWQLMEVAEVRVKGGLEAAVRLLDSPPGQRTSAEALRLVAEMERDEDQRLLAETASARSAIGWTFLTIVIATILAMLLLGVVSRATRRETARREEAAGAIREREEWFSATLASISDAVIATDGEGRIRFINPVAQMLTGWGGVEAEGRPLAEVFPLVGEGSGAPVVDPVARILGEGVSVGLSNHTLLVARDGTERPVEHCGAPIRDGTGAITGVVLCFRDVAERERVETELRASKESADAANRAKDRFLAVLSHELRKPLTPVLVAVTGMLEEEAVTDLRPALEMIRRNVEIESRLIDDLLDVSRIARGGLRLHTEVVDVHEAIRQAVGMCHAETALAGLDVVVELSARGCHALADETRVIQVFWNLIGNAAKFARGGGRLEVRTWNEGPGDRPPRSDRVVVEFRDTGIGFEPESASRIFEPFEQGDDSFRKRYGGLGLGLAISRGIVEALGGRMSASSPGRGKGAAFRLELPAAPAPAPATPAPPRPAPLRLLLVGDNPDALRHQMSASSPGRGKGAAFRLELPAAPAPATPAPPRPTPLRLLLVEDNPDTLRYLALVLGRRGHEVWTADSLGAARSLLAGRSFDLLLSDIELPDGSGLELMREVGHLPGIALSGFGSEEDVLLSESAGFSLHLTKPVDIKTLENAIAQVWSRQSPKKPPGDLGWSGPDVQRPPV